MKTNDYVGRIFKTNNYGELIVIDYKKFNDVTVKFLDTGYTITTNIQQVKDGRIKDKMLPTVCGVGFVGEDCKSIRSESPKVYSLWINMLKRCYEDDYLLAHPTYKGCYVSEKFLNFSYFKGWCEKQIGFNKNGYNLDKDILVKGNKIYSEDTCVFVHQKINKLFTKRDTRRGKYLIGVSYREWDGKFVASMTKEGKKRHIGLFKTETEAFNAYKVAKEDYIKEVANEYKFNIDARVYEAMVKYVVSTDD